MTSTTTSSPSIQYTPVRKPDAGSLVGVSYISEFIKCPRKWFYRYYQPTVSDAGIEAKTGITTTDTAPALITGSLFHEGLAEWYISGVRDGEDTGERDLEAALAKVEEHWKARYDEYRSEDAADEDKTMVTNMLAEYHAHFGPGGAVPEYPKIQIAVSSEGVPLVEQEFFTPLGYENYFMTCKADAIILDEGYLKVMEHKTAVAGWMGRRLSSIHNDAQFSGEIFTLSHHFKDTPMYGVKVNVVQKNRSTRSKYPIAMRDTTNRTPGELRDFADAAVDTLSQIDQRVERFEEWVARGSDVEVAKSVWFPVQGTFNGECNAYNRHCDFYQLCKSPDRASKLLGTFKPRVFVGEGETSAEES